MMSVVPQGAILRPLFFSIFINDTDRGIECTVNKFADGRKLSGAIGTVQGWDAIQGPGQTWEVGPQEPHKVQQVQRQGAAPESV